jgi:ABC-type multidrug transport system ATPase subunit
MQITITNLAKRFGRVVALDDVSLSVAEGQIVAVLGANGAGKTTLLRTLAGIVAPAEGEIRYDGQLFRRDRLDLRRRFCFLPDFPEVFGYMTVLRHLGMVVRLYETDQAGIEEKILALLKEFDILPLVESPLGTLSRGQLYKAALVGLLTVDPEVWLLDEPFASGMDPPGIAAFRRHARAAATRGRTIIYTTQIVELAEQFSDRICVLEDGKLAAFDTIDHVRRAAAGNPALARLWEGSSASE